MKKVSYEAWAIVSGGKICTTKDGDAAVWRYRGIALFMAGFGTIQKVRVTIEPVATKKRKVTR